MSNQPAPPNKLSVTQIIASTLAAAIGIQSNKNRERDFNSDSATSFVIAGVIGTVLFVSLLVLLVRLILG